ncbi:MAG: hypothetical protein ACOYXT_00945, partial [Bacteroidota bacterium]
MKKKHLITTSAVVAIAAATIVTSCLQEEHRPVVLHTPQAEGPQPTVLGKKLKNPFAVETMRQAYANLQRGAVGRTHSDELDIRTTHLYVKFIPKDSTEVDVLERNEQLELYDYPLDYEIETPGNYYHDPNVPLGSPTPKYTAVPVDFEFDPAIGYEVLAELYLPKTDTISSGGRANRNSFLEQLEDEAMSITGNLSDASAANGRTQRSRYHPQGYIRVRNTSTGKLEGVPNVKARVRRWFEVRTAMTDNDGYYWIDETFRRDVNYGVQFENHQALIRPAWISFGPAFIDGPKGGDTWDYNCERGYDSYLWSTIMRAVYDY